MIPFHKILVILQECFRMLSRLLVDDTTDSQDIFAQILQTNSHLKKRSNEQNPNSCWSVRISADFIHKELGAVRSLSGDMAVVCAFYVCIGMVPIKPLTRVTNPKAKSKYTSVRDKKVS